jgi:hypothetical protein
MKRLDIAFLYLAGVVYPANMGKVNLLIALPIIFI